MTYRLRLYNTRGTANSVRAIENLREICEVELRNPYEVEVIDVLENPELAEAEKILATPTLVRRLPEPARRIIGDLSDRENVLLGPNIFNLENVSNSKT